MAIGYVDSDWPNPMGPDDARIIIYGYVPSKILCCIAFALFAVALVAHATQAILFRTWYFLPFTLGIIMELAGYIPRYLSATQDPYRKTFFIVQYFFIVCAPVAMTAAIYACLYKMAKWTSVSSPKLSKIGLWCRPRWILWLFIVADLLTTALQVTGAALIGKNEADGKDPTTSNNILLAGLAVQTFSFCTFLVVFCLFLRALRQDPSLRLPNHLHIFVSALITASLLVLLRTAFRLAECADGVLGYLMTHEVFFGVLEFAPIVVSVLLLAILHPGRFISDQKMAGMTAADAFKA